MTILTSCNLIPDPVYNFLADLATQRQATVLRPGTLSNTKSAMRVWTGFMTFLRLDFKAPTHDHVCMFIEYMVYYKRAPDTIKNYISNIKMALRRMGYSTKVFEEQKVKDAATAVAKNVRQERKKAPPMDRGHLRLIMNFLDQDTEGPTLRFAILTMYFTIFRQSNLAPRRAASFDATRTLTRQDVSIDEEKIGVRHKWSKTEQKGIGDDYVFIPKLSDLEFCLPSAFTRMLLHRPTFMQGQPLLVFADMSPMPLSYITRKYYQAQVTLALPFRYTLHSLRRGGAHLFQAIGLSDREVQLYGRWESRACKRYMRSRVNSKVMRLLRAAFPPLHPSKPQPHYG